MCGVMSGAVGYGNFEGGNDGKRYTVIRTYACVLSLRSVCKGKKKKMSSRNKYHIVVAVSGGCQLID